MTLQGWLTSQGISIRSLSLATGLKYATLYRKIRNPDRLQLEEVKKIISQTGMSLDIAIQLFLL